MVKKLIDFCTFNNLKIMNTFFKHKEIHKFTWEARGYKSIVDYFITCKSVENNTRHQSLQKKWIRY
jgi:hypothetical protein